MIQLDRAWLLGHIDYIWNNRHKLQNRPCAEFVITGFVINSFGCPYYGYAIDKITLGNLIKLWNNGFVYKDFPLIHTIHLQHMLYIYIPFSSPIYTNYNKKKNVRQHLFY